MTVLQMLQQVIKQISAINDENILTMIGQELSFHMDSKTDITDELTPYELKELIALAKDTTDKDTVTLQEYRKSTER